ncbi:MAG: hypothetical protein M3Y74_17240 [Chloroflexota bacterium]|nr:hypothetical protein [Chloroflexota bacterium]
MEAPDHCIQSVLAIRAFVTEQLSSLDPGHDLAPPLRAQRAACRKFLDQMQGVRGRPLALPTAPSTIGRMDAYDAWVFCGALGEMRGVIGVHVAQIAARYRLDIDDELAAILPAGDSP